MSSDPSLRRGPSAGERCSRHRLHLLPCPLCAASPPAGDSRLITKEEDAAICEACGHLWRFHTMGGMCQGTAKGIECHCCLIPDPSSAAGDSPQALREALTCRNRFSHYCPNCDNSIGPELVDKYLLASPSGDRAAVSLFQRGDFALHSGQSATWKIECDALTDADLDTLAAMLVERLPKFSQVEGVPRGGVRLASALRFHVSNKGPLLIVDDVATTGASLEQHRSGRDAIGAVLFARGACPSWVTPLFMLSPVAVSLSRTAEGLDLVQHLARQSDWSRQTFGPGARTAGVVDHIRKELREIEAKPDDLSEWIDVVILGFDGAWRSGHTPEQIVAALVAKQSRNEGRTWPDWRTMPADRAIEHDRTGEAQSGDAASAAVGKTDRVNPDPSSAAGDSPQALREVLAFVEAHIAGGVRGDDEFGRGWKCAMHNVRNRLLELRSSSAGDELSRCNRCGGPHAFDISIPSAVWNPVIRPGGEVPDMLCGSCIIAAFAKARRAFTATLWGDGFDGEVMRVTFASAGDEPREER